MSWWGRTAATLLLMECEDCGKAFDGWDGDVLCEACEMERAYPDMELSEEPSWADSAIREDWLKEDLRNMRAKEMNR